MKKTLYEFQLWIFQIFLEYSLIGKHFNFFSFYLLLLRIVTMKIILSKQNFVNALHKRRFNFKWRYLCTLRELKELKISALQSFKLCLIFGASFCHEVQGTTCEFLRGVFFLLSKSVKKDFLPLWEQSVANYGGYLHQTKHVTCPGASFQPFQPFKEQHLPPQLGLKKKVM